MVLFTPEELQAWAYLLSRITASPTDKVCAEMLFQRLVRFCSAPEPESDPIADAMAVADALDEMDAK